MKRCIQKPIIGLIWAITLTGAYFYGYTTTSPVQIPERVATPAATLPSLEPAPSWDLPRRQLNEQEEALLDRLRQAGGDDLLEAIAYNSGDALIASLASIEDWGEETGAFAYQSLIEGLSGEPESLETRLPSIGNLSPEEILFSFQTVYDQTGMGIGDALNQNISLVIAQLSQENPMEAMRIAAEIEVLAGLRNDTLLIDALRGWAQVDPRAAFEWVAEDPLISEVAVLESLNPIFESLGREDFQEAMAVVDTLAQDEYKKVAVLGAYNGLLASEDASLYNLAEGMASISVSLSGSFEAIDRIMPSIVAHPRFLSFDDRVEFSSYLREISPGSAGKFITEAVRLNMKDFPAETIAWADNLEDENLKRLALERAFGTWAQVDKESAEQWLFGTERSPTYDRAIRAYIFSFLYQDDPGAGFVFAEQISDGEFRVQAQRELWAAWRAMDRPAAQAFLQTDAGRFLMEEE